MPPITALLHTKNDALRLGRCLETLYPCDHILIVDHDSQDATVQIARAYGARVIAATPNAPPVQYAQSAPPGWILALDPRESVTEGLAASLFELQENWRLARTTSSANSAYSVFLREETSTGWIELPVAQTRLVPHTWDRWNGNFPVHDPAAIALEGELLCFDFP